MKLSRYRQSVFALSRGVNKRPDYVGRSKIAVWIVDTKLGPEDLVGGAIRGGHTKLYECTMVILERLERSKVAEWEGEIAKNNTFVLCG